MTRLISTLQGDKGWPGLPGPQGMPGPMVRDTHIVGLWIVYFSLFMKLTYDKCDSIFQGNSGDMGPSGPPGPVGPQVNLSICLSIYLYIYHILFQLYMYQS